MAETKGFEPSRRFPAYSLSRGAPSTTRPRLRRWVYRSSDEKHKVKRAASEARRVRNMGRWLKWDFVCFFRSDTSTSSLCRPIWVLLQTRLVVSAILPRQFRRLKSQCNCPARLGKKSRGPMSEHSGARYAVSRSNDCSFCRDVCFHCATSHKGDAAVRLQSHCF